MLILGGGKGWSLEGESHIDIFRATGRVRVEMSGYWGGSHENYSKWVLGEGQPKYFVYTFLTLIFVRGKKCFTCMDYVIHFLIDTHTFYKNISGRVMVKHSDALFYKKVTQSVVTKIFWNFWPFLGSNFIIIFFLE